MAETVTRLSTAPSRNVARHPYPAVTSAAIVPPTTPPSGSPTAKNAVEVPRPRLLEYSAMITGRLAITPPTPIPVSTRQRPSWTPPVVSADRNIPTVATARQASVSGRRPIRSASGATRAEPSAMPIRPLLSSSPTCDAVRCHSAATPDAAKAITRMSKPSTTFITRHSATTMTWNLVMGDLSITSGMFMDAPSGLSGGVPDSAA